MSLYLGKEKIPGVNIGQAGEQKAVLYEPQTLTQSQQKQARDNIGVVVDPELSSISKNPVENQVIFKSLEEKADLIYVNNNFANALKETMSGPAVATDMVSPIEHQVECKVESINILPMLTQAIPQPSLRGTTIEILSDGRIHQTGTHDASLPQTPTVYATPLKGSLEIEANKNYAINIERSGSTLPKCNLVCELYDSDGQWQGVLKTGAITGDSFTAIVSTDKQGCKLAIYYQWDASEKEKTFNFTTSINIAKGDVIKPYTPYVPDLTAVTVTRCGKNLFDGEIELGGLDSTNGEPVSDNTRTRSKNFAKVKPDTQYTISRTSSQYIIWVLGYNSDKKPITDVNFYIGKIPDNKKSATFTTSPTTKFIKWYNILSTDLTEKMQIEYGDKATEYTLPDIKTYTPASDGTVEGMTSLSPNMTILSDNAGVNIEATYNADTKKYIDKKFEALNNAVLSMGGNI